MDRNAEEKTACLQKENPVPVCEKKKSGIPVWKGSQTRRAALAAVSEFQQNIQQNNNGHRPTQQRQPAPPTSARPDQPEKGMGTTQRYKSDSPLASDALFKFKAMPSTPKPLAAKTWCPASEPNSKPGHSSARLVSLIQEQEQSGVVFQQDSNALQSILTDTGITMSTLGSVSQMFRPQRATQEQGRPAYTPAKHAMQVRNSVYIMESRMSLIDSCNQYKMYLRHTRGLTEESESASPLLARGPPKVAVSESPLVKGMKAHKVKGSVFPQWSHHTLHSPVGKLTQSTSSRLDTVVDGPDRRDPGREGLFGTPKTPAMAFSRVPVTPLSSRHRGVMPGTPGTPASAYGRVAVTPARRVLVQSASKTGSAAMQRPESMKKRLRWADILSSCSPDVQRTRQTAQPAPSHSSTSTAAYSSYTPHSALKRDAGQGEPSYPLTSADQRSSQATTRQAAHPRGMGEASSVFTPRHAERWQDARHVLPSSVGGPSTQLHTVREGAEGEGLPSQVRDRHRQETAVGDWHFTAAARDERPSSVATERGVTPMTCDNSAAAAGTTPSQTDILKGLQVLEEREHVIQREMQLHRMDAVQADQEAASNATHVSRSQASHEQRQASCEQHQASREQRQANHEQRQASREQHQANHEQHQANHEQRQASREQHQANHEQHQANHEQRQASREQHQANHEQHQANHEQRQASREQHQASREQHQASHEQHQASHDQASHEQRQASREQHQASHEQHQASHEQHQASHEQASHEQRQASHSAAHHSNRPDNPLSDAALLRIVLKGPCFHLPQATSVDQGGVSGVPSPGLESSAAHSPPCSTTGNLESRHASTTMVSSERSFCSVDSHASTSCLKTSHSMYPVGHRSHDASAMTRHTGKAPPDVGPTKTRVPDSTPSFGSQGMVFEDNDASNGLNVMLATDQAKAPQYDANIESSQCVVSSSESESSMEYEVTWSDKVTGTLNLSCSHGAQPETDQHEHDSETLSCEMIGTQTQGNSEAAIEHHHRQSMNMDVEKSENEATPINIETRLRGLKTSLAPLPGTVHEGRSGRVNPVSVIVHPTARSPSLPTHHQQKTPNLPFSPPIWTTLALQCAAASCHRPQPSSGTMHPITAPARGSSISLPPCTEPDAVVENLSYDCLSLESVKQDSPTCSVSGSLRPVVRADDSSSSERCPLQCSRDRRQGRENSDDVFVEALLEDECALYAGRLQSFFRDLTSGHHGHHHPPDPVARILSEGDDMHFLPICEDGVGFNDYRPAPIEHSAFVSYVPV